MRHLTFRALAALCVAAAFALAPSTASNARPAPDQVSGLMTPDNPSAPTCVDIPDALGSYVVTGTLTGCWYIDGASTWQENGNGGLLAAGTETFVGCLGSDCGRLHTTFTFTAQFADDGTEIHGRCHHPIVSGEGDFEGATGVINMHDLPNGCATYAGHVSY